MGVYIQVSEQIKQPYGQKVGKNLRNLDPHPLPEG